MPIMSSLILFLAGVGLVKCIEDVYNRVKKHMYADPVDHMTLPSDCFIHEARTVENTNQFIPRIDTILEIRCMELSKKYATATRIHN